MIAPPLAALVAGAALAAPAAADAEPRKEVVRVLDNYFLEDRLTLPRRSVVVWRWPGLDAGGDVHDVKLRRGPKGVKRFHSEAASGGYRFRRRFFKPGRYRIVCTLHEDMEMTIRIRRRS